MNDSRALRLVTAARLLVPLLALAPIPLAAQSTVDDFDLRPRATPTPATPPVVGPSDPDNPTVRTRPRAEPTAEPIPQAAPLVLPGAIPAPTTTSSPTSSTQPRSQPRAVAPQPGATAGADISPPQVAPEASSPVPVSDTPSPAPATTAYQPRQLDVVSKSGPSLLWALLGGLAAALVIGGWLAWSRHFRHRARALPAPEILRPHVPSRAATPAAPPPPETPLPNRPAAPTAPALGMVLQATRMSATLLNTTLSYRLSITNNGAEPLHDVIVAGDMIAAHASRPVEELLGAGGAALPELHRIAGLAPGENVILGGDIRLPLVSITPIRSGNAALFVPLARLRARGTGESGAAVEGGGTFLVGQPGAAANARLQPFRLDLGPRNYSKLGQQLLSVA